jgi:hypothetical protein
MRDWHSPIDPLIDEAKKRHEECQKECQKEIDEVFKTINEDQAEYDKQLLTLSSGFLAVSLAFIKDVVPLATAIYLPALYIAFGLFACCILTVLSSFQFSIWGQFKAKRYWENQQAGSIEGKFPFRHAILVIAVNLLSGILFALGVSFLVIFVALNLSKGAAMSNKPMQSSMANDGACMKTPPFRHRVEKGQNIKTPAPAPQKAPAPNSGGNNQPKKP